MRTLWMVVVCFAVCGLVTAPVRADPEDGRTAIKSGDAERAFELWKPLAERGEREAQFRLGTLYEKGEGVKRDLAEAHKWYVLAWKRKHPEARKRALALRKRMTKQQFQDSRQRIGTWIGKFSPSLPDAVKPWLGYWEPATPKGLDFVCWIKPDGDALFWMAVINEFRYALNGNRVTLSAASGGEVVEEYELDGDRMTQISTAGEREIITRTGSGKGLLGVWKGRPRLRTMYTMYYRFRADGTLSSRMVYGAGRWTRYRTLSEDAFEIPGGARGRPSTIRIRNGRLESEDGMLRHVRVGAEPWYGMPDLPKAPRVPAAE